MSDFKIIVPEATTNLFTDPRFGAADPDTAYDISGDGAAPDVTRVTTDQWIGDGCAQFDISTGTQTTMKLDVSVTATSYTMSMRVKRSGGGTVSNTEVQAHFDTANGNFDSITALRDNWYLCVKTATATAGTRAFGLQAKEASLLSDGWQLENLAYRTTYTDGDLVGNRSDGYIWNGTQHASTSTRHAQERSGGRVRDWVDDLDVLQVHSFSGWGSAPRSVISQPYAILAGSVFQGIKINDRFLDFSVSFFDNATLVGMYTDHGNFLDVISKNKVTPVQPFRFRYVGGNQTLDIDAALAGGLEGISPIKAGSGALVNRAAVRFQCNQPFWRGLGNDGGQLDVNDTGTSYFFVQRLLSGEWSRLGTGANAAVHAVIRDLVGNIIIGGNFTSIDGVSADRAAKYTLATNSWSELGNGLDAVVRALAVDSTGAIYAGGEFSNDGDANTVRKIAKLTAGGSTWAEVDSGLNNIVRALAVDSNDNVYIGGDFTADGTGAGTIRRAAVWNGTSIAEIDAGLDASVYAMVADSNDDVYIGGAFNNDGPVAVTTRKFAKYDGANITEISGGSINNTVFAIVLDNLETVWIGGQFTGSYKQFASWDGTALTDAGTAFAASEQVISLAYDSVNDRIYLGGTSMTSIGSPAITVANLAMYDKTNYHTVNIVYAAGVAVNALNYYNNLLSIGTDNTNAEFAGSVTVTNDGTVPVKPKFIINGPGVVYSIVNATSDKRIYFDGLTLVSGETLTVDLGQTPPLFSSDIAGDVSGKVWSGSNTVTFELLPGNNDIFVLVDDATATGTITWVTLYDGVGDAS